MDTRSVVRSRRRSTRLIGQSPEEDRPEQPTTGKKRDSRRDTSHEPSCPAADPNSKDALLIHDADPATEDAKATKASAKDGDNGIVPPLFSNLPSSKAKAPTIPRAETESTTAPPQQPVPTSPENTVKDHVSNKWIKTARGSIRLASDSPVGTSKNDADRKLGEVRGGQNAATATATRRSRGLTCMVPDMRGGSIEVEPLHSRRLMAIKAEASATVATGSDKHQKLEPDLQALPTKPPTEQYPATHSTHHDELPVCDGKTGLLDQEREPLENISPIPELVADIERIILSSPLAGRKQAGDGTKGTRALTPTQTVKKRAPASTLTSSRTLRSSTRSIDNTDKIGKSLGFEQRDSDSSQFNSAFDDSIREPRKTKAQVECGTANTSKPHEPRGIKRSAQELSEAEGSAASPSIRQRRNPGSDGSNPEFDLSSSNPIEAATSRDTFAVDDPNVEAALDISEFSRRTDEPPNVVLLAQMISTDPDRADSDTGSTRAWDGSQCSSPERAASDKDSTRAHDGSREATPVRSLEGNAHNCADCGRVPDRYLVCSKCLEVVYCGRFCQLWDYPLHKVRCHTSDEAVQAEVELQEAYLGDMWAAALKMLKEESIPGGTVESLLLGEAVRHSLTARPALMGQARSHASHSAPRNSESVDRTRAMSIRVAQAAQGSDE